jgi:hypothetical protein
VRFSVSAQSTDDFCTVVLLSTQGNSSFVPSADCLHEYLHDFVAVGKSKLRF